MDREQFRLAVVHLQFAVTNRTYDNGKLERDVLAAFNDALGTVEGMIRELKPVFRPGFVGDNPVWACGKLRDDFEDLRDQNETLHAEVERLRAELETVKNVGRPLSRRGDEGTVAGG